MIGVSHQVSDIDLVSDLNRVVDLDADVALQGLWGQMTGAIEALTIVQRCGDYRALDGLADKLAAEIPTNPDIALKLARIRMTQGDMVRASAVLDAVESARLTVGESLVFATERDFLTAYRDQDIRAAIERSQQRIASASPAIDKTTIADATRAAARIAQMGCVYREIDEDQGARWRSRLLDAGIALEGAGKLDDAFDAYLNHADWPHQAAPERLAHLNIVASNARAAGLQGRAAVAHLNRASALIDLGAPSPTIEVEIEQARADFVACGHVTGPLEIARVRETLKLMDRTADTAALKQLADAFEDACVPRQVLSVLVDLSQVAHERGQLDEAASYRAHIDTLAERVGLGLTRFGSDFSIVDILLRNRRLSEAIAVCREGLRRPAPKIILANYRQYIATCYSFAGDKENAIREQRAALFDYEVSGAEDIASIVVAKLANDIATPRTPAAFTDAEALLEPWVERDLERGDREAACVKLDTLARFAFQQFAFAPKGKRDARHLDTAEVRLGRARTLARTLPLRLMARQLGNIAQTAAQIGQARGHQDEPEASFAEAVQHYEAAGLEMEAANSRYIIGVAQLNQAADAFRTGDGAAGVAASQASEARLGAAQNYYDHSRMRSEGAKARLMKAQLRINFSEVAADPNVKLSTRRDAVQLLDEAFASLRAARVDYVVGDRQAERIGKLNFAKDADQIARLALEAILPFSDEAEPAWSWVNRAKSGALIELMDRPRDPPAALVNPLKRLGLDLLLSEEIGLRTALPLAEPEARAQTQERLAEIYRQLDQFTEGRAFTSFRTGDLLSSGQSGPIFTSPAGAPRRGIFVNYWMTRRKAYIVTRRAQEKPIITPLTIEPEQIINFVKQDLQAGNIYMDTLGWQNERLREVDALISPLRDLTQPDELVVLCPTGAIHAIPLHALCIDRAPLILRNPVIYTWATGITNLSVLRRDPSKTQQVDIWLLGDPSNNREHSRRLVQNLGRQMGVVPMLGNDVTPGILKRALQDGRLVHVQGHAVNESSDVLAAYLECAGSERLNAREIMALEIRADLVAMGACASGAAVIAEGDEPSGLVPSLLIAGARSTLATLWPIDDRSAAIFMQHFYQHLNDGKPKVDALRAAMLHTRQQPGFETPYHWAPYVLHGDWL